MRETVFKIPFAEPWVGEEEARRVYEAVRRRMLRYGDNIEAFEKAIADYIGVKYAVAVSSGTAALHVAVLALGISLEDDVIVPAFSCAPPALAAVLCGARPVFADIEEETLNLSPEDVKARITERTKAIVPIHYAGHPAEMDEIKEIAEDHGLYLIEDAAEALGAVYRGKKAGSLGDVAILSFSPNKTITTGEGGMILTDDAEIFERCRIIRDYGQRGRFNYVTIGNNYRMTELQAAMGVVQAKKIEEIVLRKNKVAKKYDELLGGINQIRIPIVKPYVRHAYMSYYVRVPRKFRDELRRYLEMKSIETRIYFPPLHKQLAYCKYSDRELPVTEKVYSEILNIPISPLMTDSQIYYVCKAISEFFGYHKI